MAAACKYLGNWTPRVPTECGFYWVRAWWNNRVPEVVRVYARAEDGLLMWENTQGAENTIDQKFKDIEWQGPIKFE